MISTRTLTVGLLLVTALSLAACRPVTAPATGAAAAAAAGQTYTDPWAYCAAVGTTDTPAAPYAGPAVPDSVITALRTATNTPADAPNDVFLKGTSWRCMDGSVYACFVGANIPCDAKADTDKTPTPAMDDFCQQNPTADVIPAAVTGHATVYAWSCKDGKPAIDKQVQQVDAQGYQTDFWYKLPAPK